MGNHDLSFVINKTFLSTVIFRHSENPTLDLKNKNITYISVLYIIVLYKLY